MKDENLLSKKLDEYINKYYLNQVIRGGLIAISVVLLYLITVSGLEYVGNFGTGTRAVMFYSLLSISMVVVGWWVMIPLLRLWGVMHRMSHIEAAGLIGNHFDTIEDKLLNTLQLAGKSGPESASSTLLIASLDQRISELSPVPFASGIDLSNNKRFLRYAAPPVAFIILAAFLFPALFTDGTGRLIAHSKEFQPVAPFTFTLIDSELRAIQNEDLPIEVWVDGESIPAELMIELNGNRHRMSASSAGLFSFTARQLQESTELRFYGGGFYSESFTIEVVPKPVVSGFSVKLQFPKYLERADQDVENAGDLVIPEGTVIDWQFTASNSEKLEVAVLDSTYEAARLTKDLFQLAYRALRSADYSVITSNTANGLRDSIQYSMNVVPDRYPSINVAEVVDTLNTGQRYFRGNATDDHGFSSLVFHHTNANNSTENSVHIDRKSTSATFYHSFDFGILGLAPGDEVEYYFEVWDNDGVNGAKSSRTPKVVYKVPSADELAKEASETNNQIKDELKTALEEAKKLREDLEKTRKKLLEKSQPEWEDKQMMKNLIDRQKNLQKMMESVKQENQKKNNKLNQFNQLDESVLEKQRQLEELFEDVMTDEMKELFEKMEEMMEELTKDKAEELLEDMEFSNEDLEKEIDRSLELFKQLEFEQKLEETKEKLEQLAEKQNDLAEESDTEDSNSEELEKKQEELNEEFEDIKKDIDELEKKNEELETPNEMEDTSKEEADVDEEQEESSEKLSQDEKKKASESQKNASKKMQEMAQKMGNMMAAMQSQSEEEDLDALRQIIENLLTLSFDQEELIDDLKGTKRSDPHYTDIARTQQKLQQDSKIIEDSLYALSKRHVQIETVVNREIRSVNQNMKKSLKEMADRKTPGALTRQQLALTSVNNLALLLSEVVDQMQQQMASMMQGSGSCSKPGKGGKGKGKPSASGMKKLQEQLNAQMEKMKNALEKGKQDGGKKPGEKPGQSGMPGSPSGMSKELAKMAAQQEALRNMVRDYEEGLKNKPGADAGTDLKDLSKLMEQTETDLVNKKLTLETIRRQQEIMTRLLEAENAERERDKEERRESEEATDKFIGNPEQYFEYNRRKNNETELLRTVPPNLTPFYRSKVDEYFSSPLD